MRYLKLSDAADIKFCSVAPARMKTQEEKTKWFMELLKVQEEIAGNK